MSEITETRRRTQAYWFEDGIAELVGGVALLILGGALLLSVSGPSSEVFSRLVPGILILAFPASAKIVSLLKDRITHPRTGFVGFSEKRGRSRMAIALMVLVVALGFVAILADDSSLEGAVRPIALAAVGAGACTMIALRALKTQIHRLLVAAAALAGATTWAVLSAESFSGGLGVMWITLGVAGMLTGTLALTRYLRTNPRIHPEPS